MDEKIDKLQNKINWHTRCEDNLQKKINILYKKGVQKKIKKLFDSKILGMTKWKFGYANDLEVRIHCQGRSAEKTIIEIMGPGWGHESIEIQPGIILKFDDGEIDLIFNNSKICKTFINEQGIKISIEKYQEVIKGLQKKINFIKKLVNIAK